MRTVPCLVREVTADGLRDELRELETGVDLGVPLRLDLAYNALHAAIQSRAGRVFLIVWHGSRVPRNVTICGHRIAWTQHGRVISDQREQVGVYNRVFDLEGADRLSVMTVYLNAAPLSEETPTQQNILTN